MLVVILAITLDIVVLNSLPFRKKEAGKVWITFTLVFIATIILDIVVLNSLSFVDLYTSPKTRRYPNAGISQCRYLPVQVSSDKEGVWCDHHLRYRLCTSQKHEGAHRDHHLRYRRCTSQEGEKVSPSEEGVHRDHHLHYRFCTSQKA